MQDLHFCPGCGAAIQPNDRFCTSCGFALNPLKADVSSVPTKAEVPEATPLPHLTASTTPSSSSSLNKLLPFIILLIIGGAVGLYFWEKNKGKDKPEKDLVAEKVEPKGPTDTTRHQPGIPVTENKLPGSYSLDDYVGVWQVYESNESGEMRPEEGRTEDDLIIEKEQGKLIIYPRSKADEKYSTEMSCGTPVGHVLSCRAKDGPNGGMMTLTLELSGDKEDITFSAIPDEPTEKMIVKMRRRQ